MSTLVELVLVLLIGSVGALFFININQEINRRRALKQRLHKINMMEERNKQVYYFRTRMIAMFSFRVDLIMPTYEVMMHSDKPLDAKEWIDVDKLVNLN